MDEFQIHKLDLDNEDLFSGMLSAIMFAIRATYHTTLQATPCQLVFGRDAVVPTEFQADWEAIKARKQAMIDRNNCCENSKHIDHKYQVGDYAWLEKHRRVKHGGDRYEGPYIVCQDLGNGSYKLDDGFGKIHSTNSRKMVPHHSSLFTPDGERISIRSKRKHQEPGSDSDSKLMNNDSDGDSDSDSDADSDTDNNNKNTESTK